MNKLSILALIIVLFSLQVYGGSPPLNGIPPAANMRLIAFNETYRVWMTEKEVEEKLVGQECGAGHHGGFMDITDHPNASPSDLHVAIPDAYPDPQCHYNYITNLFPLANTATLTQFNNALTAFFNRYYTTTDGVKAAEYIRDTFVLYSAGRSDIKVTLFPHSFAQPSVIARIEGTTKPNEVIVLGAHEDSITGGASSRAPGADDDASGVSTLLQIYKILANDPNFLPDRSIEFQTYAAEEVGLRGSDGVVANYQSRGIVVVGMLQFDMTFFTPTGKQATVGMITDFTNAGLTEFVRTLVDTYLTISYVNTKCGYGCSDHASWNKYGYPAAFAFETTFSQANPNIHTQNDVISMLNLNHGLQYVRLGLAFATELGFTSCTSP